MARFSIATAEQRRILTARNIRRPPVRQLGEGVLAVPSVPDLTADSALTRGNIPAAAASPEEKAESVDALRDAVVEAAGVSMGLWLSYLFVLFYFAIAAGGVTHRDLFFESPIKLPFLNVDLPLVGFFVLAPALVLIVHAYVLLHVVLLSGKIRMFNEGLGAAYLKDPTVRPEALRRRLPSNIFVQYLAGPKDVRTGIMGNMLRLVAQVSLVACPVGLLVLFQLQFLPFHRWDVTWWHRFAVLLDVLLLWALWPLIANGAPAWLGLRNLRRREAVGLAVASLSPLLVVFTLATYPGERLDTMWSVPLVPTKWPQLNSQTPPIQISPDRCAPDAEDNPNAGAATKTADIGGFQHFVALVKSMGWSSLYTVVIAGGVDPTTRRPTSLWPNSNRIVLPGFDITDQTKFDTDQKIEKATHTASLRGRHLEGAVLCGALLRKVDFTGAILSGSLLNHAQLQGATLDDANFQDAKLKSAALQGASLVHTQLQRARLNYAQLQGADLRSADLELARLQEANLGGASLQNANLRGASLRAAGLQAAALEAAELSGANLSFANLQGASLVRANLNGANLTATFVRGVDVREINGVDLRHATLQTCWSSSDGPLCQTLDNPSYDQLQATIKDQVPAGDLQRLALARIQRLAKPLEEEAAKAQAWVDPTKRWNPP
jgi:uncharacterized protein YjbI with pentapeptide repeats